MRSLSVLIVDDEAAACENMADILEMAGHEVTWFSSPQEAWLHYQRESENYDLAILDLKMPEMNGVELLKKLRLKQPELPAILTTAYSRADEFTNRDLQLFESVLDKPVDIELLLRKVLKKDFPLVICVDDDPEFCDNLSEIFSSRRIQCECFHDFESAKSELASRKFDVALLDVRLPDVSGIDAARELKKINPDIRNFIVTGYPSDVIGRGKKIIEMGINQIFEKPLQPDKLLKSISQITASASDSPRV